LKKSGAKNFCSKDLFGSSGGGRAKITSSEKELLTFFVLIATLTFCPLYLR
jgi:hypothetical protein